MMDLSQWKTEYRNKLFNGKYKYRVTIRHILIALFKYNSNIEVFKTRVFENRKFYRAVLPANHNDIVEKLYAWRNKHKNNVDFRPSGMHRLLVMTNDVSIIEELDSILPISNPISLTIFQTTNVKYFKRNVKYHYRAYLKVGRLDKKSLSDFFNYAEKYDSSEFKFSGRFDRIQSRSSSITTNNSIYNYSNLYVEYNDETHNTMLSLRFDDLISKIYKCEKITE